MPIILDSFPRRQERLLRQTLEVVSQRVRHARLPADLASRLRPRLARTGEPVYLTYRGNDGECGAKTKPGGETKSYTYGPNQVYLCEKGLTLSYRGKPRLGSILLHELVHTCGGTELDAETYENALFGGDGATPPDAHDYRRFAEDDFRGLWVQMDPPSGDVTDTHGRLVITFRPARRR